MTLKVNNTIVCPFNYNIISNDRRSRVGGVTENSLKVFKIKKDLISFENTNFEYICIDVTKKNKNHILLSTFLYFLQKMH